MQKKKSTILSRSDEEIELKKQMDSLQKQRRKLVRKIDDLDTEIIGLRERLLYLKEQRKKKSRQL